MATARTSTIHARVTPESRAVIDKIARDSDVDQSTVVRAMLSVALLHELEVAQRIKIIKMVG